MRRGLLIGLGLSLLALPASAQVTEPQALVITARNVTAQVDGRAVVVSEAGLPDDVIEYRLAFTNLTDGAVSHVVLNDPLPKGLIFIPGSVTASREDMLVEYSIDGGVSWSFEPTVEVQEGGETVIRPAPAEIYTHVRWTVTGEVKSGAQVFARFRTRVAGGAESGGDA